MTTPVPHAAGRVELLDYCRGVMASAVMVYHYNHAGALPLPQAVVPVIQMFGVYAVATFYVLSGATLAIVYKSAPPTSGPTLGRFWIRRLFRLAPVLWLATIATVAMGLVLSGAKSLPSPTELFLNLTMLFGLFDHDGHIATGAWSIGNELVFYLVFPLLMLSLRRKALYAAALAAATAVAAWFAFAALDPARSLSDQNWFYMHPLNQFFLFVAGVGIGGYAHGRLKLGLRGGAALAGVAILGLISLSLLYSGGELITGWQRFAFSGLCALLALACVSEGPKRRGAAVRVLAFLGIVSYSLYLLHPLVMRAVRVAYDLAGLPLAQGAGLIAIVLTLAGTWLCYRLIEAPAMALGHRLTPRRASHLPRAAESAKPA